VRGQSVIERRIRRARSRRDLDSADADVASFPSIRSFSYSANSKFNDAALHARISPRNNAAADNATTDSETVIDYGKLARCCFGFSVRSDANGTAPPRATESASSRSPRIERSLATSTLRQRSHFFEIAYAVDAVILSRRSRRSLDFCISLTLIRDQARFSSRFINLVGCDLDSAAGHRAYSRVVSVRSNIQSQRKAVRAP